MYKTTAHTRLTRLIKKYNKGTVTAEEAAFVEQYYNYFEKRSALTEGMTEEEIEALRYKMLTRVHEQINNTAAVPVHRVHFLRTSWFRYAAAVILIVGGAATWWQISQRSAPLSSPQAGISRSQTDIAPGTNRAILTIDNNTINLSNSKTGIAIGNAIAYNDGERIADAGQVLQLATPRGGQYQAVLPDGSKVWLNAASSIKFPSKFTGDTREVEVTGEVYLEVAQNAKQPFYVHTRKTSIQVLGTSFNVNAYEDEEAERTTLIEGSVRVMDVRNDRTGIILKPSEQAKIFRSDRNDERVQVQTINANEVIAWKNGYFSFENAGLNEMARQIERWYDIKLVLEGNYANMELRGKMDRGVKLSDVIRFFNDYGFKTRLEGKILTVINN